MRYLILLTLLGLTPLAAQVSLTQGSPTYVQSFDTLTTSGTLTWTDNTILTGWYATQSSGSLTTYRAGDGTSNAGALYSFGTGTTAERALGSIASGTPGQITYGLRIQNGAGQAITALQISYTGEQWRNGGNTTPHALTFWHQVGATNLTGGTWTSEAALTFTGPIATATAGALDGNLLANRVAINSNLTVSVSAGQEIWIRWTDPNDTGNDHGLALDDLSITATFAGGGTAPTVTSVANNFANAAGGESVTITGTDFTGATGVTFGGAAATSVTVVSATTITCTVPAGTGNSQVDVSVTTPAGTGTLTNGFNYLTKRLTIADVAVVGYRTDTDDGYAFVTWVALNANEFLVLSDKSFDGTDFFPNENALVWRAPAGGLPVGAVVTFSDNTGSPIASDGTILSGAIDGLSASGDQLFIFQGDASPADVLFGANFGNAGWLTTGTATNSESYLPAALNVTNGNFDFTTTSTLDNGQFTGSRTGGTVASYRTAISTFTNWTFEDTGTTTLDATDFTIGGGAAPTVTNVSVRFGNSAGGQNVTLTGTNFTGATAVNFGSNAATNVVVVTATSITCTVPAGTGNTQVNISVTTPGGTGSMTNGFTYMTRRLAVGDAWVVGFRTVASDGFAFVAWVAIQANEIIAFTDDSYDDPAGANNFRNTEDVILWQAPSSGLAAGTVVVVSCPSGTPTVSDGTILVGNMSNMSGSGDQVFVFQGDKANADVLFGLNFANAGWLTTGTASSNNSFIPPSLNTTGGNLDAGVTNTADNAEFTGSRSGGTVSSYKTDISNFANWTFDNAGTTIVTLNGTDFTFGAAPSMNVNPGSLTLSAVSGTTGTPDSFTLTGSNLTGAITVTAPTDCEVSITGAAGTYLGSQNVPAPGGTVNQVVHVRIASTASAGTWSRTVTNVGGGATQQNVTINGTVTSAGTPPTVTDVDLPFGNAAGGQSVTLTGTNFTGATGVAFGTNAAGNVTVVNATTITCTVPAGTGNTRVDVAVTTASGTGTLTNGFIYMTPRLAVGDAWIIGYRLTAPDGFAFVPWVNLNANEIIGFTDDSFNGTSFLGGEDYVIWQAPSAGLAAGSVVVFAGPNGGPETATDGTVLAGVLDGQSASGDQLFIFQGDKPNLVFGIAMDTPWLTSGTADGNNSYLPAALNVANGNLQPGGGNPIDNGQYTGARTGMTLAAYRTAIANFSNWTFEGTGTTVLDGTDFTIAAPNVAPVIGLPNGALAYTENDAATVIEAGATCTDADSADFSTGTLTVDFTAGGTSDDRIEIRNQGTGAGQIGVTGSTISFSGTNIGTFAGGIGTTALVVTFNASSSPAACQALMRNVTYRNVSDAPATAARTVRFVVTDGDGGTSNAPTKAINLTDANDAPVLTLPGTQSVAVSGTLAFNTAGGNAISMADVDAGVATVRVNLTVTGGTLATSGAATITGNGTAALQLDGTLANVNATLQNLVFTAPGAGATVTLGVTGSDLGNTGTGGTQTDNGTVTINVTTTPGIVVPGGTLNFTAAIGSSSPEQSYSVTGQNLTGSITITATAPFQVSITSGAGFSAGATLPAIGGTLFVRYTPTAGTSHNGTITHAATGVTPSPTRAVAGTVFLISTASLPNAAAGSPYMHLIAIAGGVGPYGWTITSGPSWLSIDATGLLNGTPANGDAGNVNVTVQATDTQTPQQVTSRTFGLTVTGGGGNNDGGGDGDGGSGCSTSTGASPWLLLAAALAATAALRTRRRA